MSFHAGEAFVEQHLLRKFAHIVLDNAAGTVTIDATNTDPNLVGKVDVVTSATTSAILASGEKVNGTDGTFTGANGTTIFGIALLDGAGRQFTGGGLCVFHDNTIANGSIGGMAAAVAGGTGITDKGNVAVKATFVSTLAAKTGKAHIFLEYV